jgi:hypothetical protein
MARKKIEVKRKPLKVKKTRKISEEQKEKLRERLAKMRAKKKPAEYKNISKSVLAKPDDDKLSMKNVKAWIKETKDAVSAHSKNARGRGLTPQVKQRELNSAEHKKAYIRYMEHYLKTGDWISNFMGAQENEKTTWKCVAMAYHPDGTPKRSAGVFYSDINMVWKQDMIEANYVPVETISQTVAITDKQFTANL